MLNLKNILKNCAVGEKFYSSTYDCDIYFESIDNNNNCVYPINFKTLLPGRNNELQEVNISVTNDGKFNEKDINPSVFPSKNQRDWDKFQREKFIDGDIIYNIHQHRICIYYLYDGYPHIDYCRYNIQNHQHNFEVLYSPIPITLSDYRFATDEEKMKLLSFMKKYGYKFNDNGVVERLFMKKINNFNKGDVVLVRDGNLYRWKCANFSHIDEFGFYCMNDGSKFSQCIPYNEITKHFIGEIECVETFFDFYENIFNNI